MDAPALATRPEELLRHARWVRALVRELVRDADRRADVEQETWLAALTRLPRELGDPKGWLRRVTLNALRQGARGETRRVRRERAAARPEALPSTVALVEQADLQRRVVRGVLELEEPYRTTILLSFFRGLTSAEIARGSGSPASTVRDRLQHGLAELRRRFERELGSGEELRRVFGAWLAASAPAPRPFLFTPAGIALLLCGLVAVAVPWMREPRSGPDADPAGAVIAATSADASFPIEEAPSSASQLARAPIPALPRGAAQSSGRVVDESGAPVEGALVTAAAPQRFEIAPVALGSARTDPTGSFALPATLAERPGLLLLAEKAGYAPGWGATSRAGILITLRAAATVEGTVLDAPTEAPLAGVRISFGEFDWSDGAMRETVTDERGRFRCPRVPPGTLSLRLARPGDAFQARRVSVPPLGTRRIEIRLPAGGRIEGRVVDGDTGAGLAGAEIVFDFAVVARSDPDGAFAFGGVERTERHDLEARLEGHCMAGLALEVDEAWPAPALLPLFRECVVAGTVVDGDGRPLPHVGLQVHAEEPEALDGLPALPAGVLLGSIQIQVYETRTDELGRFAVDRLEPWRSFELVATSPRNGSQVSDRLVFARPGTLLERNIAFPRPSATLEGCVRVNGAPIRAWLSWKGPHSSGDACTDERGAYRIETLEAGPLTIRVQVVERGLELTEELVLPSGAASRHDFVLAADQTELVGTVRYPDGAPIAGQEVLAHSARPGSGSRGTSDASGVFRLWITAVPGEALRVRSRLGPVWTSLFPVPAGARDVELVLPRIGALLVRVLGPRDADLTELEAAWREGSGGFVELPRSALEPLEDERWSIAVPCGRIDLELRAPRSGCKPVRIEGVTVDARSGASAPVVVAFEREQR